MAEYIEREAVLKKMQNWNTKGRLIDCVEYAPAADVVSRSVFEQVKWERDMAMEQLKDHKIPFGCIAPDVVGVVRCEKCKHYETSDWDGEILCGCNHPSGLKDVEPNAHCSYGERKE